MVNEKSAKTRQKLRLEDVTAKIDTREQRPLILAPLRVVYGKLDTADYSVDGLEDKIAIEKKSLDDLIACVGRERDRFDRMVKRLREFKYRAIVVTDDWCKIDMKQYRGTLTPTQIYGAIMGWAMSCNVPIMFMGDHQRAGLAVARMLYICAQREHRGKLRNESGQVSLPEV